MGGQEQEQDVYRLSIMEQPVSSSLPVRIFLFYSFRFFFRSVFFNVYIFTVPLEFYPPPSDHTCFSLFFSYSILFF